MRSLHFPPIAVSALSIALSMTMACQLDDDRIDTSQAALESDNGLSLNGMSLNGLSLNGLSLNGMSLNGLSLNGLSLNGLAQLGTISFADLSENLQAALSGNHARAQLARSFLRYFGKCAMEPGSVLIIEAGAGTTDGNIVDDDGSVVTTDAVAEIHAPLVLEGVFGIAAGWPAVTARDRNRVASCLAGHVNPITGVAISLRSSWLGWEIGEPQAYNDSEGALSATWADTITGVTCRGANSFQVAHLRSFIREGGNGFAMLGYCADICATNVPDAGYDDCEGFSGSTLSSFLSLPDLTRRPIDVVLF